MPVFPAVPSTRVAPEAYRRRRRGVLPTAAAKLAWKVMDPIVTPAGAFGRSCRAPCGSRFSGDEARLRSEAFSPLKRLPQGDRPGWMDCRLRLQQRDIWTSGRLNGC